MRRTRLLILASIVAIVAAVGVIYTVQKGLAARSAPPRPAALPERISAKASHWTWTQQIGSMTKVEIVAQDMRQVAEPSRFELTGVELRVFDKSDQSKFDKITSAKADFDINQQVMFSEGEVEIILGMKVNAKGAEEPSDKLLKIKSSGVRFETKAAKVMTDRPAEFTFDRSEGRSTGAQYDSVSRELRMDRDVVIKFRGAQPKDAPMEVTAGSLLYKEGESKIYLSPWAKLVRGGFTLEGGDSVVTLLDGSLQLVETQNAKGGDRSPGRTLDYSADHLNIMFTPDNEVEKVVGTDHARLVSTTDSGQTTVTTKRVDLDFTQGDTGALLKTALATGDSLLVSKPTIKPNTTPPDDRIVRSEVIELLMRPGGKDTDMVRTHTPGTIDFVPNRPGQKKRTIGSERMWITYGDANRPKYFRAVIANTRSERETPKGKPPQPPALTWSHDMEANFDPATGQLSTMDQWPDFRYEEGDRRASAEKATMVQAKNEIVLNNRARVWDPSGSTNADRIILNQQTGGFEAIGNVASMHVQDQKDPKDAKDGKPAADAENKPGPSPMFSGPDPVEAKAARMTMADHNNKIHYEGNAILWQGPNRVTGDRVDIDRKEQRLEAHGNVFTQMLDKHDDNPQDNDAKPAAAAKTKPTTQVFTTVRASDLVYSDKDRIAHYTGGVLLNRPGLTMNSQELRAWMSDTSLDRAFADGQVKVVQAAPDRTRTGTGEHAEYYLADQKMIMNGGKPTLVDTVKGVTRGRQLTWFASSDRLLIEGAEPQPAVTKLRKK
jgi:lipopolysaccharide export system protein LptA